MAFSQRLPHGKLYGQCECTCEVGVEMLGSGTTVRARPRSHRSLQAYTNTVWEQMHVHVRFCSCSILFSYTGDRPEANQSGRSGCRYAALRCARAA
eukprot:6197117-Pleurochrysis_carterae.AAC.1